MDTEEKKKTIRNIGYLSISKIIVYLLSIITITLIPRYLGVENYGYLNFVLSFIGIFAIFGDLGINTLIFRDVSKNSSLKDKYFNNLFLPKMFLLFLISLIMIGVSFFINKPLVVKQMIFLGLFFMLFHHGSSFIYKVLASIQLFKYQAYFETFSKVFYVIFALIVIYFNLGLLNIFLAQVLSFLIMFLFLFLSIKKYINFRPKLNISFFIKKLKYSWPFALAILFTVIFFNFDKLFISFMKGDYQLGLYAVGVTFVTFLIGIISVFGTVFFNLFSKYSFTKQVTHIFNKFLKYAMLISFPIFFGGMLLSREIIVLVFGSEFALASTSFAVLLFFFLLISISTVFNMFLLSHNKEKYVLKIRGVSTIINIILNIIFIPIYGIIAAAITTVISEAINLFYLYKKTKPLLKFNFFNSFFKIFISSIVMFVFVYFFKYFIKIRVFFNSLDVLFIIVISGFIYFMFLYFFKIITIKEIKDVILSVKK